MPGILPEINESNLLYLGPSDSISFEINLSEHYDFKRRKKKDRTIYIEYVNIFPLIENSKQVYQRDDETNNLRPVYFVVAGNKVPTEFARLKFILPRR